MQIRESRLLVIAVALGMLAVLPLACGGKDNNSNNNNGDTDQNSITTICTDIKDKLGSCSSQLSCSFDTTTFVSDCVSANAFTASDRDELDADTCSQLDAGICPHFTTGTCSDAAPDCVTIDNFDAVCTSGGNAPSGKPSCTTDNDCNTGSICISVGQSSVCLDTCAAPACVGGNTCQDSGDSSDASTPSDTLCLVSGSGNIPADAQDCTSADCPVNFSCFNVGSSQKRCIQGCFLETGTSSVHDTARSLLQH